MFIPGIDACEDMRTIFSLGKLVARLHGFNHRRPTRVARLLRNLSRVADHGLAQLNNGFSINLPK